MKNPNNKINKKSLGILAAAIMAAPFAASGAYAQGVVAQPTPSTISINTSAKVNQAPDLALISGGVITQAKDAKTAMADNSRAMVAAIAAVKAAGIAEKDIQTSGVNISPQYVYAKDKPATIKGYQVSNTINVKVRDMAKVGPVLDAMVEKGLNNVNGPNFTVEDPDKYLDGARTEAMTKAINRANLYAKAAGMRVKRVITISENSDYYQPPVPMYSAKMVMAEAAADAAPVQAGEVALSVNVSVTFELEK